MRWKMTCQSAARSGDLTKALLVHEEYKDGALRVSYHFINNAAVDDYQDGDLWLVEHTLLRRGTANGHSRRK